MDQPSDSKQQPEVCQPQTIDGQDNGGLWNNEITRRSFLKRSGTAGAATVLTWHGLASRSWAGGEGGGSGGSSGGLSTFVIKITRTGDGPKTCNVTSPAPASTDPDDFSSASLAAQFAAQSDLFSQLGNPQEETVTDDRNQWEDDGQYKTEFTGGSSVSYLGGTSWQVTFNGSLKVIHFVLKRKTP